jgi:pimeloyl-ACP methyl ester carboxylesterase
MMVEVPLPPGIERCSLDTRRGPIAALRAKPRPASGRTSVMVCGFMATKEDFRQILPLLAREGYDAWAYDHLGQHGGEFAETPDDGPGRYTIQSMAEEGCEVTEAVGAGEPVHIVGHCFGGFVARAIALAAPSRTQTLTMLSCGPSLYRPYSRAVVEGIDDLLRRGGATLMWPLLKRVLPKEDQVTRDFWYSKLSTVNPHYLRGVAQSLMEEDDRSGDVAAAGIRSLVMHGSREKRLWRPAAYADMARDLQADLVVIDKAGHNVNMEQPETTARNLIAFWDRAEAEVPASSIVRSDAGAGGS